VRNRWERKEQHLEKRIKTSVVMRKVNRAFVHRLLWMALLCEIIFSFSWTTWAQVVYSLNGGTSTFSQSQGGWATLMSRGYDMEFGGGTMLGRYGFGGLLRHPVRNTTYSVGDTMRTVYLPTDLFMGGRTVFMTGLGVDSRLRGGRTDLHFYGGGVSDFMQNEFFTGARPQQIAAMMMFNGKTGESRNWKYTTQLLLSKHTTLLQGMQWSYHGNNSRKNVTLAVSGGLADMHNRYGAGSADMRWKNFNLRAEYVAYGKRNTPLLNLHVLQYGEPVKENAYINYRPFRFLMLQGSRRNLLVFPSEGVSSGQTGDINTTDMVGATLVLLKMSISGTYVDSHYKAMSSHGESFGIGRSITRYAMLGGSISRSYSRSYPTQRVATAYLSERIMRQLNLRQTYVRTNTQSYMSFGGDYYNDRFSAGVYYNTTYVPTNIERPFQPNYSFTASGRLTHRINVSASKSIDPYGKGYYMVSAGYSSYSTEWAGNQPTIHVGDFVVRGQVITSNDEPVPGIAVQIDKAMVYTDMNGNFELREKEKRRHHIEVILSLSATDMVYEVVSAPSTAVSVEGDDPGITIVVRSTNKFRGAAELYKEHQQTIGGQAQISRPVSDPAAPLKPASAPALAPTVPVPVQTPAPTASYGPYKPYQPAPTDITAAVATSSPISTSTASDPTVTYGPYKPYQLSPTVSTASATTSSPDKPTTVSASSPTVSVVLPEHTPNGE